MKKTINQEEINRWKLLIQDFNDVYRMLVPGIVCEGLLTRAISMELAGSSYFIMKKELVYLHPVHLGDMITVEVETIGLEPQLHWITEKVVCLNEAGIEVIKGQIILKILSKMEGF